MRSVRHALRERRLFRAPVIHARMLLRPRRTDPGGVLFLFYHRVAARDRAPFERQLRRLRDIGDLVGVTEALAALSLGSGRDRRICLTFDDGWDDALRHAAPVLIAHQVPATFFVVSDWVGRSDRASWDELRRLRGTCIGVGSHSRTHTRLALLDDGAAAQEMRQSRARIEQELGGACEHFAAPYGSPGEDFRPDRDPALARALGFRSFFTTSPRRALPGEDRFVLPRIRMEPGWGRDEIAYALWR